MIYVQYYHEDGREALGDRGVVILDDDTETMHEDARNFNGFRRPEYHAYRIFAGRGFSDSIPITQLKEL